MNNPEVILADEPTGNLDTKTGHEIIEMLIELNKEGKTIIMITHERSLAKYSDRVCLLKDGQIISCLSNGNKKIQKLEEEMK